LIRYSLWWRFR